MTIHPAVMPLEALLRDCTIARTRRGGPGGQHRNKVETAVVITHQPTGIAGQASERRSQDLNRQAALQRLRINLALQVRTDDSATEAASDLWQSRTRGRKISVSPEHEDFPALLAEVLDRFAACDWDASVTAEALGITASQLVKFLQVEPAAMELLNQQRHERGLKRLR